MFHAELAYKTVQQEITQLTEKQNSRTTVLNESKIELEQDHAKLMAFIAQDNAEKK
jgi:hypothetical protein